jgi:hypothetical protein
MLAAIARGLRLTLDERDHLFRLAGHTAPARTLRSDQFLIDPEQGQTLLVLTATPGTESYEMLQLLSVIGTQALAGGEGR